MQELKEHIAKKLRYYGMDFNFSEQCAKELMPLMYGHYAPIIEGKDKEIAELKNELERRTGLLKSELYMAWYNYYCELYDIDEDDDDEDDGYLEAENDALEQLKRVCKEHNLQPIINKPTQEG